MTLFSQGSPWLSVLIFSVLFLVIFRKPIGWLLKLVARSAVGLGFLALWSASGLFPALGVNAFNAVALGLLGLPGFGLLLLLRWMGT